ncbi:MAG: hypothetical protein AB3A66_27965 (plasmid) [Nodularia sp. CChRGM 3473]
MKTALDKAIEEYQRLCNLIGGNPPYGDCELVALMLYFKAGGVIAKGQVIMEDGEKLEHFWLEVDNQICDPLSKDWTRAAKTWVKVEEVSPNSIIENLNRFLDEFPDPSPYSPCLLRWKVKL